MKTPHPPLVREQQEMLREVGQRLRDIRRRAGLTHVQLGDAMGRRGVATRTYLGDIESGKALHVHLDFVLDYLRACGAGAMDLAEVIDKYTGRPFPREQAAGSSEKADGGQAGEKPGSEGTTPSGAERLPTGARSGPLAASCKLSAPVVLDPSLIRLQRKAGYWVVRAVFEHFIHSMLTQLGAPAYNPIRRRCAGFMRRVFHTLFFTRGPKAKFRSERLERARKRAGAKDYLPNDLVEGLELVTTEVFNEMERADELSWVPPLDEAREMMARKSAKRVLTDAQMCMAEWYDRLSKYSAACTEVQARAQDELKRLIAGSGLDTRQALPYSLSGIQFNVIAQSFAPGAQRDKQVEAALDVPFRAQLDRKLLERISRLFCRIWDEARPNLPPVPGPRPR